MRIFALLCLALFVLLCNIINAQSFVDLASAAGVDTTYGNSYFGSGISFVDFNFDGLDDLTIGTDMGDSILFYKNNGDGSFMKLPSLVADTSLVGSILWVDIDNDFDLDLFVCGRSLNSLPGYDAQNRLYENLGDLNLVDITTNSGIKIQNDESFGASFGDYDKDGDLDLFVSNRINKHSIFYRNNGNKTFTDITESVGIIVPMDSINYDADMCSAFLDFDNDGDLDLYTVTDKFNISNKLYVNNGNGHFDEMSNQFGTEAWVDGMTASVADIDNDGWSDIYVTNTDAGARLLYNDLGIYFIDRAPSSGINVDSMTSWGALWVDVDNDKDQDLYVCTEGPGFVFPWRNFLFKNIGEPGYPEFEEYNPGGLPGDTLYSFCTATADFNNDGRMDVVVSNGNNEPIQLWTNQITNANHSIRFTLRGDTTIAGSNSFGVGSRIEIYDGDSLQTRFTHCGINYLSQNSLFEHVGMGNNLEIDSLIIHWNSGTIDKHYHLGVDESYVFHEGQCLDHTYKNYSVFNQYIGPNNGNLTLPANWSKNTLPSPSDRVLIDAGNLTYNLINLGIFRIKSLVIKGNVSLTNTNTIEIRNSDGAGLIIESPSNLINNGLLILNDNCGEAIKVEGTFTNNGNMQIAK